MYEEILGCKVNKQGFIISSTHPFLGLSPDGGVLEECLVEVEKNFFFFPGTVALKEAVCCRGICKKSSSGLLNQNHAYYNQVQQELFSFVYECKDLVLSDLRENIILSIKQISYFERNLSLNFNVFMISILLLSVLVLV